MCVPAGAGTACTAAVTYTPAADYHGTDSLTYTINDGHGNTATATVHVTINSVNDAPVAVDDSLVAIEDTGSSIDVTLNDQDVDGDALTVAAVSTPRFASGSTIRQNAWARVQPRVRATCSWRGLI